MNRGIRAISKRIMYVVFAAIMLVMCYISYLWYTYIDETIMAGEAYGFEIGDDKLTTYKKAPMALANIKGHASLVYYEVKSDLASAELLGASPGYNVMVEATLHEIGYPIFKLRDRWDFYVDGSYFNVLSLKFCDERLCEIYRHRKNFEIP